MSFQPRAPYSEAELKQLYPPSLRLHQVQVFMRHGERTPVNVRFANAGLAPYWPYCGVARNMRSSLLNPRDSDDGSGGGWTALDWRQTLETFGKRDEAVLAAGPAGEVGAVCDQGQLTDRGRETTYALGERLRTLYVNQLGFLPPTIENTKQLYLRSTMVPRALESMQQAFLGLYPASRRGPNFPPLNVVMRVLADETLFPNDWNCRRMAALARAFAARTALRWNDSEELAYMTKQIGQWMPGEKVAVDGRPRLTGILDTVNATDAHGPATKLPAAFYDARMKKIMEKISIEEWFAGYAESNEFRTLGIGGLLADVVDRMVHGAVRGFPQDDRKPAAAATANAIPAARFGISGCHDTTLAAMLSSLGAFNTDEWPPFTSHIAVELFRKADASLPALPSSSSSSSSSPQPRQPLSSLAEPERQALQDHYVRIRYNDVPVAVPGCRPAGRHLDGDPTFCTLEAFKAIVDKFTPRNWKEQCLADVKAPAIPDVAEPAGL